MRSTKARITLAGACLALAGTPLLAQQPAPTGDPPTRPTAAMPMMDCPMMSAMMHGPAAALRADGALGLSAPQRVGLKALQRRIDATSKSSMQSMHALHAQLTTLAQRPQLDEGAARVALDQMGRAHTEMGLAMLRASHEAAAILTPVQRDSLAAIATRQMSKSGAMPMHGMPMHSMPRPGGMPKH